MSNNPLDVIYFEAQIDQLCAQHALNMLLQGPFFEINQLGNIARELDQEERSLLNENPEQSRPSSIGNYNESGYFSFQVIQRALARYNLEAVNINNPVCAALRDNPGMGTGYICNSDEHWFTIRRFNNFWFMLNSMENGPIRIPDDYLSLYFHQVLNDQYSIFAIQGDLPECAADLVTDFPQGDIDRLGKPVSPQDRARNNTPVCITDVTGQFWSFEQALAASLAEHERQSREFDIAESVRCSLPETDPIASGSTYVEPIQTSKPMPGTSQTHEENAGQPTSDDITMTFIDEPVVTAEKKDRIKLRLSRKRFLERYEDDDGSTKK